MAADSDAPGLEPHRHAPTREGSHAVSMRKQLRRIRCASDAAAHRFRQRRAEAVFGARQRAAALQMDFDFKGGGGFVVARRALSRAMPEDFAVTFRLRGRGAANNLELKLVDATGQNVWRHVQKDLQAAGRDGSECRWTAGTSSLPGVRRAAGASGALVRWSSPSSPVRAARARCGLPMSRSRIAAPRRRRGSRLERTAGIRASARCPARLETPAGDPALDRDRFDGAARHRRIDHRLAESCAGERLSHSRLEQRPSLEDLVHCRDGGRQTQLCVPARAQDEVPAPGSR